MEELEQTAADESHPTHYYQISWSSGFFGWGKQWGEDALINIVMYNFNVQIQPPLAYFLFLSQGEECRSAPAALVLSFSTHALFSYMFSIYFLFSGQWNIFLKNSISWLHPLS